ncbi:MAG TPA: hypothetical protein PKI19_10875 [Elusimicrobiales bacterium]|nr:hypothetical protein [Elusimicrobiales bacterium]
MGKKEDYIAKLNSQLKAWGVEIDRLSENAERAALEHRTKLLREITEFKARRLEAQLKLRQFGETSGDAWELLTEGMDKAWAEMKETVGQIAEKLKQPR